jgi:hypothetical protein
MPARRSPDPNRRAALEAAKRELSAAQAELRLALQGVKAGPRANKVTISDSLQAAFNNLVKVKKALTTLER